MMPLFISAGFLFFFLFIIILINNGLVRAKNKVDKAYSSIKVYLKKRFDLIPNLVSVVQKYALHEKELLTQITEIREKSDQQQDPESKVQAENEMNGLLSQIKLKAENYPDLKADQQFLSLQFSLNDIEEQLSAARRAYNAAVTEYNDKIQVFPSSIIANFKNYQDKTLFTTTEQEEKNIEIAKLF